MEKVAADWFPYLIWFVLWVFIFSTFLFISLLDSTNIQDKIQRLSQRGSSYLLVAKDGNLEGMVVLIDSIRPDAAEAIQLLNKVR